MERGPYFYGIDIVVGKERSFLGMGYYDVFERKLNYGLTSEICKLSTIAFQSIDYDLQMRFYKLVFPVIKRRLYHSSKKTAYLGKRPRVFVASAIRCYNMPQVFSFTKLYNFPNDYVIDVRGIVRLDGYRHAFDKGLFKFFDFNHGMIELRDSNISSTELKILFNANVRDAQIYGGTKYEFTSFLRLLPNLEIFYSDQLVPLNFLQLLLRIKSTTKPMSYTIHVKRVTDLRCLREFLLKQIPGFRLVLFLKAVTFEAEDLKCHFNRWKEGACVKNPTVRFICNDKRVKSVFIEDGEFSSKL